MSEEAKNPQDIILGKPAVSPADPAASQDKPSPVTPPVDPVTVPPVPPVVPPVDPLADPPGGEPEEKFEEVPVEELKTLRKKATDFDGIIEKRRLENLNKPPVDSNPNNEPANIKNEDIQKMIDTSVDGKIQEVNRPLYEENLIQANRNFLQEHPWADNEENFSKISEAFDSKGSLSVDQLTNRLKRAAQDVFPTEYEKSVENNIKRQILAEDKSINNGDITGGPSDQGNKDIQPKKKLFVKKTPIESWYPKPGDNK